MTKSPSSKNNSHKEIVLEIRDVVKTYNSGNVIFNALDHVGLKIFKSGKVVDRGENELDRGQYNSQGQVFGVSGACAFYRLVALEDIKFNNEYFDEDFFAYKEDIDISYRLRWRGWKIYYCPQAISYHHRQVFGGKVNIKDFILRRQKRSSLLKYYSYRNHLYLLIKNKSLINFFRDFFFIFFYELGKFFYILFFEPKTLEAIRDVLNNYLKMFKKRRWIMKNKKIKSVDLRRWFN